MEKKKVRKKYRKKMKKTCLKKVPGMLRGCFWTNKGSKKIYIEVVTTKKKKSQNENPQRWIDSQLNSASFKTDFRLKGQKKNLKILVKITIFTTKTYKKIGIPRGGSPGSRRRPKSATARKSATPRRSATPRKSATP